MSIPAAVAAGAALVCFVGGTFAGDTVCKPAPKVEQTDTRSLLDKIVDGTDGLVLDELKPLETRAPKPSSPASPSTFDVKRAASASFGDTNSAYKSCNVALGRTAMLTQAESSCLINTGSFTAAGTPPVGSVKPGVVPNSKGEVCSEARPMWFWGFIPFGLLSVVLLIGGMGRREDTYTSSPEFAGDPDLPDAPAAPSFDAGVAGGQQQPATGTTTPPRPTPGASFDAFDDEDF
ncbi:hypothetical protein [Mycolicibacterium fallax]|uniref:hypothetical protein n=1 Tax=Mycolicibacterium fallax TaxID=1793 RepID=UPI0010544C70|nr:hypothetical protein [Mycolicibacterium fallax]BBY99632.1 hypothetical protein MFAL_30990 [Mycolicibacterium fallax]